MTQPEKIETPIVARQETEAAVVPSVDTGEQMYVYPAEVSDSTEKWFVDISGENAAENVTATPILEVFKGSQVATGDVAGHQFANEEAAMKAFEEGLPEGSVDLLNGDGTDKSQQNVPDPESKVLEKVVSASDINGPEVDAGVADVVGGEKSVLKEKELLDPIGGSVSVAEKVKAQEGVAETPEKAVEQAKQLTQEQKLRYAMVDALQDVQEATVRGNDKDRIAEVKAKISDATVTAEIVRNILPDVEKRADFYLNDEVSRLQGELDAAFEQYKGDIGVTKADAEHLQGSTKNLKEALARDAEQQRKAQLEADYKELRAKLNAQIEEARAKGEALKELVNDPALANALVGAKEPLPKKVQKEVEASVADDDEEEAVSVEEEPASGKDDSQGSTAEADGNAGSEEGATAKSEAKDTNVKPPAETIQEGAAKLEAFTVTEFNLEKLEFTPKDLEKLDMSELTKESNAANKFLMEELIPAILETGEDLAKAELQVALTTQQIDADEAFLRDLTVAPANRKLRETISARLKKNKAALPEMQIQRQALKQQLEEQQVLRSKVGEYQKKITAQMEEVSKKENSEAAGFKAADSIAEAFGLFSNTEFKKRYSKAKKNNVGLRGLLLMVLGMQAETNDAS